MTSLTKLLRVLYEEYGDDVVRRAREIVGMDAEPETLRTAVKNLAEAPRRNRPPAATRRVRPSDTAPVSRVEKRKREAPRTRDLTVTLSPRRYEEPETFDLTQHEGRGFITSFADMAEAGDDILAVNDVTLAAPVQRLGGQGFMFDDPDFVWANDLGGVNKHLTAARRSKRQTGQDPLFLPWTMSPTSIDFAHQPRETMLRVGAETLGKRAGRRLSKEIESIVPGFRDIADEDSIQLFRSASGASRKQLNKLLDNYREEIGLGIGSARLANTDLDQIEAPLTSLRNVGFIDSSGSAVPSSHPSFPYGIPGSGLGRLDRSIGVLQLLPDLMREKGITSPFDFPVGVVKGAPSPLRTLQMKPAIGILTHDVLKSLEAPAPDFEPPAKWLRTKREEYRRGGRVQRPCDRASAFNAA